MQSQCNRGFLTIVGVAALLLTLCTKRADQETRTLKNEVAKLTHENIDLKAQLKAGEAAQMAATSEANALRQRVALFELRATPKGLAEATILGSWCAGSDVGYEEFSLEIENGVRTFSSWLHHKPDLNGTWELNGHTFSMRSSFGEVYVYTVVSATRDRLVLQGGKDPSEVYLRRGCRQFQDPYATQSHKKDGQ